MPQASIQVPVLMSLTQKRRLARKAKAANMTMSELLRQGGERFSPAEDDAMLDQFAKQQNHIEDLTGRVIRLETALEIALGGRRTKKLSGPSS